jgi:hypothetical protein
MADGVRTPRTRGSLSGLALILLGAWGAVAPYAGPSFGFGFTPDHAWQSTSGRLYLSAIPGGVVVLAGLIVLATRSRGFGAFWAFIAALAGAWFIAGAALLSLLPASLNAGISTGVPLGSGAHIATLTSLALFGGLGAVIVFFAALALGRFSIAAHRDYYDDLVPDDGDAGLAAVGAYGGTQAAQEAKQPYSAQQYPSQYPASTDPFPPEHYASATEQYPAAEQYPATGQQQPGQQQPGQQQPGQQQPGQQQPGQQQPGQQQPGQQQPGQYQAGTGYPQHDPFGLTQDVPANQYQRSQAPFPPAPFPGYPERTTPPSTTAFDPPGQDQPK